MGHFPFLEVEQDAPRGGVVLPESREKKARELFFSNGTRVNALVFFAPVSLCVYVEHSVGFYW
jgi:hypothetical protein